MSDTPVFRTPKPWNERYDTHVANPWVEMNPFPGRPQIHRDLPDFAAARALLPDPFWEDHEAAMACYWRAWELAFGNLKQPNAGNDFAAPYCDTAFNGNLFMWDSAFISGYGLYGRRAFDFLETLDTFYRKQNSDGFISREISELDGQETFHRFDPSSTGPNVLGWAEWNAYLKTGHVARLADVFPALAAYHQWTRKYRTWQDGSYWTTGWGTGMDNLPRLKAGDHISFDNGHLTWVDATLQAILSTNVLLKMALALGIDASKVADLEVELEQLTSYANKNLWDESKHFYCDRLPDGHLSPVKHIGAYWALLAGAVPDDRLDGFIAHLDNPAEFKRLHCIPALSADDPGFDGMGDYWSGGVWAPTNYMVLKGLEQTGCHDLAHQIALNHLENVVRVFESEDIHWDGAQQFQDFFHLDKLTYDDSHTLWENYAPDYCSPGSHSKPGYVGWTGLPPIAVLFEDVFGLKPEVPDNRLTWRVNLLKEHGVRRYPFGGSGILDLRCSERKSLNEKPEIEIQSNIPLTMELIWEGGTETLNIKKEI